MFIIIILNHFSTEWRPYVKVQSHNHNENETGIYVTKLILLVDYSHLKDFNYNTWNIIYILFREYQLYINFHISYILITYKILFLLLQNDLNYTTHTLWLMKLLTNVA